MNSKTNCAGQGCAERDSCRRYIQRIPMRWEEVSEGVKFPVFAWASLDIERRGYGPCLAKIELEA